MTTVTAADAYARPGRPVPVPASVATITARNLRRLVRVPTLLVFATVQPVLFVLLFTYAFGGAIHAPGVAHYIDYLLPGLFVLAIGFGAAVLTIAAFAVAAAVGAPGDVTGLLAAAAALSLLHSAATGRAAPAMFQIGRASDSEAAVTPLLTRFARWSAARAALQTATLIVVAIAMAIRT